jgi:teichoic acid transport system permease protein
VHYQNTYYFWLMTLFFFALGVVVFKRLRPHFADVI